LVNLSFGNKKTLEKLARNNVHLLVANLLTVNFDADFLCLIAVLLGNLVESSEKMCKEVID